MTLGSVLSSSHRYSSVRKYPCNESVTGFFSVAGGWKFSWHIAANGNARSRVNTKALMGYFFGKVKIRIIEQISKNQILTGYSIRQFLKLDIYMKKFIKCPEKDNFHTYFLYIFVYEVKGR